MKINKMRKYVQRARQYYLAPTASRKLNESEESTLRKVVSLDDIINESIREYNILVHRARKNKTVNYALFESLANGNTKLNRTEVIGKTLQAIRECEMYEAGLSALKSKSNKADVIEALSLLEGEKFNREKRGDYSTSYGLDFTQEEINEMSKFELKKYQLITESEDEEAKDEPKDKEDAEDDLDLDDEMEFDLDEPEAEDDEEAEDDLDAEEGDTVNLEKIAITVTDIDRIKKELKDYGIPEEAIEEDDVEDNEDQDGEVRKGKVKIDSEYALELRDFFKEKYDIDLEEKLGIEIEEAEEGDDGTNADDDEEDSDEEDYSDDDIFKVDKEDDFDDFFGDDEEEEDKDKE